MAKTKLNTLKQAHGKEEDFKPTTLEQIWGYNANSRYNTTTASEYESQLNEMTRTDLEDKSRQYGLVVVQDTVRLRANLLKEFNQFMSSLRVPKSSIKQLTLDEQAKKILAEGR